MRRVKKIVKAITAGYGRLDPREQHGGGVVLRGPVVRPSGCRLQTALIFGADLVLA